MSAKADIRHELHTFETFSVAGAAISSAVGAFRDVVVLFCCSELALRVAMPRVCALSVRALRLLPFRISKCALEYKVEQRVCSLPIYIFGRLNAARRTRSASSGTLKPL